MKRHTRVSRRRSGEVKEGARYRAVKGRGCQRAALFRVLPLLLLAVGCSGILNKLVTRARAQKPGACNQECLTWQVLGLMAKLELALFRG